MAGYKDKGWITPRDIDSFYVYALYDLNGWPFYIGKGKNNRVNNHTKPTLLKDPCYKNYKIKKIISEQGFLRREILCYCDSEESALDLEKDLIQAYGIYTEGGLLTNHCKSHWDLPDKVYKEKAKSEIVKRQSRVPDDLIIKAYDSWKFDYVSILSLANELGISSSYLGKIFEGKKRKDLGLRIEIPSRQSLRIGMNKQQLIEFAEDRFINKLSYSQLMKKYNMPKTTVARVLKMEGVYSFLRELYPDFKNDKECMNGT